jgi:epoxide hydrolase 4
MRGNPAQQGASQYMLMFRSTQAEQILAEKNYAVLVNTVLGEGLNEGYFTPEDRQAYLDVWSRPYALTGGLNYYRAARVGPPAMDGAHRMEQLCAGFDVVRCQGADLGDLGH